MVERIIFRPLECFSSLLDLGWEGRRDSPKFTIVPPSHCPSDSAKNRRSTEPFTNREERILRAIILTTPPNARRKPSGYPGMKTFETGRV